MYGWPALLLPTADFPESHQFVFCKRRHRAIRHRSLDHHSLSKSAVLRYRTLCSLTAPAGPKQLSTQNRQFRGLGIGTHSGLRRALSVQLLLCCLLEINHVPDAQINRTKLFNGYSQAFQALQVTVARCVPTAVLFLFGSKGSHCTSGADTADTAAELCRGQDTGKPVLGSNASVKQAIPTSRWPEKPRAFQEQ